MLTHIIRIRKNSGLASQPVHRYDAPPPPLVILFIPSRIYAVNYIT